MTRASDLKSLAIRATKGNELTDMVTEDFQKDMFQTTIAAGLETTKVQRIHNSIAALGARGDYLDLVAFVSIGTSGQVPIVSTIYVEAVDFTGVPTAVQHTVFGKYSPFVGPKEPMNESMMDGIDRQEMAVVNTEIIASHAALKTAKTQLVRGSVDSRVTYRCDANDLASVTEMLLRFKPNSDGVFMLRAGARIWAQPTANGMG